MRCNDKDYAVRSRRHSALDYLSPEAFEALHTTTA